MFLIFKILPDWLWWILLASGLIGILLSYLPQVKTYELLLKSFGTIVVAATIFILGMLYCDNAWKSAATELQAKVTLLAEQSKNANDVIKEKTVTKLQIVKVRGQDIVQYVDREVTKGDTACQISPSFVQAHNQAAEVPK